MMIQSTEKRVPNLQTNYGKMHTILSIKQAIGKAAADLIQDGMLVGLGSGSTASCFIQALIVRCQNGLRIQAIPTSEKSLQLAEEGGIPLINFDRVSQLDITVDGADEIDPEKRMIKGGGGALLSEKIVASSSKEMVVIVDETKLVSRLCKTPLPVEIVPFGYQATIRKLEILGYTCKLRQTLEKKTYVTDNHNFIVDIPLKDSPLTPEEIHLQITAIPGVVETGFFFGMAGRVIVGYRDGHIEVIN